MMAANKGSESALSNGDNPGTLGVPEVVHLLAGVHGEAVGIDQTFAKLKRAEFKRGNDTILATGLMVTLYVEEAHRPERRAALTACFDDYWNAAGSELRWISQPRGLAEDAIKYRWAQPSKQTIVRPAQWVFDLSEDHPWSVSAHGGASITDASTYTFEIGSAGAWEHSLSFLSAAWPLGFFEGKPETFRATVRKWIDRLQPLHGYGGIGVLLPLDGAAARRMAGEAFGLAMRFPGLELDAPVSHVNVLANGIKGVNWLTAVGDRLLDKLGGGPAVLNRLDQRFEAHRYGAGLLIQAGRMPELGDVHRHLVPEAYRDLSRMLAPLRAHFEYTMMRGISAEQSAQWLSRFD